MTICTGVTKFDEAIIGDEHEPTEMIEVAKTLKKKLPITLCPICDGQTAIDLYTQSK